MLSNQITIADVTKLVGVTRHKVRSMMRDLPGFNDRGGIERVATRYNEHDLAVLAVCFELEERYGLRRDALAALVGEIRKVFPGKRPLASGAFLHLVLHVRTVRYLDKWARFDDGLLFPLDPIIQRLEAYVGQQRSGGAQRRLHSGPVVVGGATHKLTAASTRESNRSASKAGAAK